MPAKVAFKGAKSDNGRENQKSMQRPAFSQSPKRVGSGPSRPPISFTAWLSRADGEPAAPASVPVGVALEISAAGPTASGRESGREFVSAIEPDDDVG